MDIKTLIASSRPLFSIPFDDVPAAISSGTFDEMVSDSVPTVSPKTGGSIAKSLAFSLNVTSSTTVTITNSSLWISSRSAESFSVECWVQAGSVDNTETKFLQRGSDYLYFTQGAIGAVVNGQRISVVGVDVLNTSYVCLSYDNKNVTLYVGKRVESMELSAPLSNTSPTFTVASNTGLHFNISMLSGYARSLTSPEIESRVNMTISRADLFDLKKLDADVFEYDISSAPVGFDIYDYVSINSQEPDRTLELFSIPLDSYASISGVRIDIGLLPQADATVQYSLDGITWIGLPTTGILPEFPHNVMTSTSGQHLLVRVSFPALSTARLYYSTATVFKSLAVDSSSFALSILPTLEEVYGGTRQVSVTVGPDVSISAIGIWVNHNGADGDIIPGVVSVVSGSVTSTGTDALMVNVDGQTAIPRQGQTYIYIELTTPVTDSTIVIGSANVVVNKVMFYETDPGKPAASAEFLGSIGGAAKASVSDNIGTLSETDPKIYILPWAILSAGG